MGLIPDILTIKIFKTLHLVENEVERKRKWSNGSFSDILLGQLGEEGYISLD